MSNRQKNDSFFKNSRVTKHSINLLLITMLVLSIGSACGTDKDSQATQSPKRFTTQEVTLDKPRKLESYSVRGFKFSYYLIPKNLNHDELIAAAQEIHDQEPDAQLILVDDESELNEYVAYAKEISSGNSGAPMPKKWADEHIIGNVQKYLSGKWVLCEGNGYREIAELK